MSVGHYTDHAVPIMARFNMPLTEMIRPQSFAEYIGQEHLLNSADGEIANYLRLKYLPSMVLSGPPGVGKTSLARLLAEEANYVFVEFSATSSTVADLKELSVLLTTENQNRSRKHVSRLRVLVFIDEIHRFSTVQQDFLLPFIESGLFVFVGATTVDPEKSVRRAILSRCHLFKLKALDESHLARVTHRAILHENMRRKVDRNLCFLKYSEPAIKAVVKYAHGDMRSAVNLIEILGSRLSSPEYKLVDDAKTREMEVSEITVKEFIKSLNKARFGLQSESNLPLLSHLLRSLRYPSRAGELQNGNGPDTLPANDNEERAADSDLESWVDETESIEYTNEDPKLQKWAAHIPFSDDENDPDPGSSIYSDDDDEKLPAIKLKDLTRHSASKFRILSATHACLQLLQRGESPLSILKYLVLFTCTHSQPEKNELTNVLSVLKAVQKSGIAGEHLLFNCIERLAGTHVYEQNSLRDLVEAAKNFHPKINGNFVEGAEKMKIEMPVVFDDELVGKLLQPIPIEKSSMQMGMPIRLANELGPEYTFGEDIDSHNVDKLYPQVFGQF